MERKETRNSKKSCKTKQNEKKTVAKEDRKGRERNKNGNQKTDCVHKLY